MLNKRSFWPVNAFPYVEPSVTNTKCTGCVALCELHLAPPAASEDVKLSYRLHRDAVAGLAFERVLVDDPVDVAIPVGQDHCQRLMHLLAEQERVNFAVVIELDDQRQNAHGKGLHQPIAAQLVCLTRLTSLGARRGTRFSGDNLAEVSADMGAGARRSAADCGAGVLSTLLPISLTSPPSKPWPMAMKLQSPVLR